MNSKELWNLLQGMETKDIMVMATMIIRYLTVSREIKTNDILKEIKKANKFLGV